MNKQSIIAELKRVAEELHSDCLSRSTFEQSANMSAKYVERAFGSWNEAIIAAGLTPLPQGGIPKDEKRRLERLAEHPNGATPPSGLSDEELLDDLVRLAQELGRRPSGNQIAAKGKYNPGSYVKRWGSVAKAYEVAMKRPAERSGA